MAALDPLEEVVADNYGNHLLARLNELREEGLFCDFTLKVGSKSFKVHRMVIASCSDYFRAMFSHSELVESNKDSMELKSIPLPGLPPLLEFAYTGKLSLSMHNVADILHVAAFLQVTPALDAICKFLESHMTYDSMDKLVSMAESYGLKRIKDFQRNKILHEFQEFMNTEQFLAMDPDTLDSYLLEDSLRATREVKILKGVLKWYAWDKASREPHMARILDKVRYTQDGWGTIDFAAKQEPFTTNKKCYNILVGCQKFMQDASRKHLNQSYRTRVRFDRKTLIQMGGIRHMGTLIDGFELDEYEDDEDLCGSGTNAYYHRDLDHWLPLGCLGQGDCRSHNPIVEVNDHGIMVGGYLYTTDFASTHQHCSNEVKLIVPSSSGEFSLWDLNYMEEPRAHHVAVHTPGYVYAIGGKNEAGPLRSVERLHLDSEQWSFVRSLDRAVFDHAAAAHGDQVYICGGTVKDTIVNSVWCYDPATDRWTAKAPMLAARAGHTVSLLGSQLVVCGGKTVLNASRCLSSVEAFCVETEQWTFLTHMRHDCCHMTAVVLEEKLLLLGGENSVGSMLRAIQRYDPREKAWDMFGNLPKAMKNLGACAMTVKQAAEVRDERGSLLEGYMNRVHEDFYISEDEAEYEFADEIEMSQLHLEDDSDMI